MKSRRRALAVLAVLGVLMILYCGYIAMLLQGRYVASEPFDSQRWKQVQRVDDETRLRMVDGLIASKRLDGLTRAEVAALLGPTSDSGYFREWDFVYWLGDERSAFGIDSEWLVIRIGPSGRVSGYRIVTD